MSSMRGSAVKCEICGKGSRVPMRTGKKDDRIKHGRKWLVRHLRLKHPVIVKE